MAKASAGFFDPEFMKVPDFTQFYADFNKSFAEYGKLFGNGKLPGFDVDMLIAAQRKNVEALTAANQVAFEGVQTIAKRQIEIARKAIDELSVVAKELTVAGTPEDKFARQAALAKESFEAAVANLRELTGIAQKANSQAVDLLSKRVVENLDEVKSAFAPKAVAAKK
jgi:phasin family protein